MRSALIVIVALVIALALAGGVLALVNMDKQYSGSTSMLDKIFNTKKATLPDGNTYKIRKDVTTFLIVGVDSDEEMKSSNSYDNSSIADFLVLAVFDHKNKTLSAIQIDRNTMTDVTELSVTGKKMGTSYKQIGYAYAYGDGMEDSCLNMVETVQNYLCGAPIDYYLTMTMPAVPKANDFYGGITLTMDRDYTDIDPSLTEGSTVTMNGELAMKFIRARQELEDSSNTYRMERQKLYMEGLLKAFGSSSENQSIEKLFLAIDDYMLTNCSADQMSNLFEYFQSYEFKGIFAPLGTNVITEPDAAKGRRYVQFTVDKADLTKLLVGTLYE